MAAACKMCDKWCVDPSLCCEQVEPQLDRLLSSQTDVWLKMDFAAFHQNGYCHCACAPSHFVEACSDFVVLRALGRFHGRASDSECDPWTPFQVLEEWVELETLFTVDREDEHIMRQYFDERDHDPMPWRYPPTLRHDMPPGHARPWSPRRPDLLLDTGRIAKQFKRLSAGLNLEFDVEFGWWWIPSIPVMVVMATPAGKLKHAMSSARVAWMTLVHRSMLQL